MENLPPKISSNIYDLLQMIDVIHIFSTSRYRKSLLPEYLSHRFRQLSNENNSVFIITLKRIYSDSLSQICCILLERYINAYSRKLKKICHWELVILRLSLNLTPRDTLELHMFTPKRDWKFNPHFSRSMYERFWNRLVKLCDNLYFW